MALSLDETAKTTHDFLNEYNYNFPLKFRVVEKAQDIYNKEQLEKLYETNDRDRRQIGFDGAYHPSSGRVVLIASSLRDTEHAKTTLRHEVVGHYGINTLNEQDKRQLLTSISNSRDEPTLQPIWAKVESLYRDSPESIKAEEVFAFVAEKQSPNFQQYSTDRNPQAILRGRDSFTLQDLEQIVHGIEHEIKLGVREQQVFPKNDYSQYKLQDTNMAEDTLNKEQNNPTEELTKVELESFNGAAYINKKDELIIDTKDDREIMFGGVKAFNEFAQEQKLSEKDTAAVYELLEKSPSAQREIQEFENQYLKDQAEIASANVSNPNVNQELQAEERNIQLAEEAGIASVSTELDAGTKERLASIRAADRELVEKLQSENTIEPVAIEVQQAQTPNQNTNENDNQVSSDEIFTPEDDKRTKYVLPQDIEQSYLKVGNKYYTKNKTDEPAFVDKGNKLETTANSDKVAESLVRIASARGWNEIKVTGTEKFRRDVWLEAATRGMEIKGYSPTEQDKVALAARVGELDKQKIAPENKDFRAREKEKDLKNPAAAAMRDDPLQAAKTHPELAPAIAGMEAIKKQNQARNLSAEAQRIINARVQENVVNSIERGHSFDTKLNEEKVLERDQEKEKEVTR